MQSTQPLALSKHTKMFSLLPLLLLVAVQAQLGGCEIFQFELHHRFSEKVRLWVEEASSSLNIGEWPEKGTVQYYHSLAQFDRALLRGRGLSGGNSPSELTFSSGNMTIRINALGFLHYVEVDLGNPAVPFLVALDTGSDLFWVPCECKICAPTTLQDSNITLNIYSSALSSTSKKIPCNNTLCQLQGSSCSGASDICPYNVKYLSSNTSTSGILLEDVLHMTTEDTRNKAVDAKVTFGCGQVQTGSFLSSSAINGLLGLGMSKISVPSMLAAEGFISDSFSMCFGLGLIGRISFGDKGSSDQEETPFVHTEQPAYVVRVVGIGVQNSSSAASFDTFVDSGTSFTILADPAYTLLTGSFDMMVQDKRHSSIPDNPFEYCYIIRPGSYTIDAPELYLTMKGGANFPVVSPVVVISSPVEDIYCLAIVKSQNINIIGQIFLSGLRVVFDREKLVLGWKKFNCYDVEVSNNLPIKPKNSTPAMGPSSYNPEATKQNANGSSFWFSSSHSSHLNNSILGILASLLYLIL